MCKKTKPLHEDIRTGATYKRAILAIVPKRHSNCRASSTYITYVPQVTNVIVGTALRQAACFFSAKTKPRRSPEISLRTYVPVK